MWCLPLHFTAPHTSLHLPPLTAADILSFISNILHNGNCLQFALVSHMNIYVVLSCLRILLGKGKTSLRGVGRDTEAEVLRENGQRNYFHRPQHEKKNTTQHSRPDDDFGWWCETGISPKGGKIPFNPAPVIARTPKKAFECGPGGVRVENYVFIFITPAEQEKEFFYIATYMICRLSPALKPLGGCILSEPDSTFRQEGRRKRIVNELRPRMVMEFYCCIVAHEVMFVVCAGE